MIYQGKYCALNTLHFKSEALAEPFLKELGIRVIEQRGDTDQLGTFSGEVERPGTMFEVLKKKCEMGIELSGFKLGLASEGSFGSHPSIPFLACDYEALLFIVYETIITENTNYKSKDIKEEHEFFNFAETIKFPSHGIIVRHLEWEDKSLIFKGIKTLEGFRNAFKICQKASSSKSVRLETDMRAHMNPTRMMVIKELAQKLCLRLKMKCPKCKMPGCGKVRVLKGLECRECGSPTEKIKEEIFGCVKCSFEQSVRKEIRVESTTHMPQLEQYVPAFGMDGISYFPAFFLSISPDAWGIQPAMSLEIDRRCFCNNESSLGPYTIIICHQFSWTPHLPLGLVSRAP